MGFNPTEDTTYYFRGRAKDEVGNTSNWTSIVSILFITSPVITTGFTLPPGYEGDDYSVFLEKTGGSGSGEWSIITTDDTGVEIDSNTGEITINNPVSGTILFTVRFTDDNGLSDDNNHKIVIAPAPLEYQTATITYTVNGIPVTCELKVVEPVKITNVIGRTLVLQAGQEFQLETNHKGVKWESVDCEDEIISRNGLIKIPGDVTTGCFGGYNCIVKGVLEAIECDMTGMVGATIMLNIKVNPYFPSQSLCGVPHSKWLRMNPDFRVIVTEMEGGCDETHIRNKVPIMRWTIDYSGLPYKVDDGFCYPVNLANVECSKNMAAAKTLDDFWMAVGGTYGYFNLYDEETGELWQNCRFEKEMVKDHVNRRTNQSRSVSIVWKPCCASAPLGAACVVHYGYQPGQVVDLSIPVDEDGIPVIDS